MSDTLQLNLDPQNTLVVYLHGATITSWISNSEEVLFISNKSNFDNIKPIRGGIPVVFPNFGPWSENRPQHGFARTKRWSIRSPINKTADSVTVTLSLIDDEETRKLWDFKFELNYQIVLKKNSLKIELSVLNRGEKEFDFTSLLHTYFKLDDVNNAKLYGFSNHHYTDKLQSGKDIQETNEFIAISAETDRIYYDTSREHIIDTGNLNNRRINLKKENFPDTVVWNPWIEKSKAMSDFGDEEYKVMICAEVGFVNKRCLLEPNESIVMNQVLTIQ